jgi:hypothetical protein
MGNGKIIVKNGTKQKYDGFSYTYFCFVPFFTIIDRMPISPVIYFSYLKSAHLG